MWVPPDFLEGTHTSVSSRKAGINIVIITQVVGDAGSKVLKCMAEGNISVSNVIVSVSGILSYMASSRVVRACADSLDSLVTGHRRVWSKSGEVVVDGW